MRPTAISAQDGLHSTVDKYSCRPESRQDPHTGSLSLRLDLPFVPDGTQYPDPSNYCFMLSIAVCNTLFAMIKL